GPKIDFHIKDALGRTWQCGTIQLDMALPDRFELEYTDKDGQRHRPIMIHRAVYGSIERFFGILIEHFAGRFPLWLSPRHIRILTVADRHEPFARELEKECRRQGFLCAVDATQESVGKKVRNAQLMQVNYILTVGDQELENQMVNVRTRDNIVHGAMPLLDLLKILQEEKLGRLLSSPLSEKVNA
ncbi:MAG: threonine--tRNA ligase, partial [Chlamydiia bacterium]|nr:threonine--tRNA ligase [Chlamydiia bacterium]